MSYVFIKVSYMKDHPLTNNHSTLPSYIPRYLPVLPTSSFIMVYPKHQALPPSPHKKVKTFTNMFPYSASNDEMNTTSPSSSPDLSSSSPSKWIPSPSLLK